MREILEHRVEELKRKVGEWQVQIANLGAGIKQGSQTYLNCKERNASKRDPSIGVEGLTTERVLKRKVKCQDATPIAVLRIAPLILKDIN